MVRKPLSVGIAWLLALVLLRSLVPAGFMPALVDGRLSLVLCEAGAWPGAAGVHAHHQHQHAHHNHQNADGDCSYAQSASPALMAAIDLAPAGLANPPSQFHPLDGGIPVSVPQRSGSARGPPATV